MRTICCRMWCVAAAVTLFAGTAGADEAGGGVVANAEECGVAADCKAGNGRYAGARRATQRDWLNGIGGGIVFQAEALFFKYHRADGVRAGSYSNVPPDFTDDVNFDPEATPRLTLGYVFDNGLGFRGRWWKYDHQGAAVFPATGVAMNVDTYTLDLEVFENFELNDCWTAEISGGVRYNEFDETMLDPIPPATRVNSFTGWAASSAWKPNGRWAGRARCTSAAVAPS